VQLWKAGEVDEAMDLLFKKRSDPDLSLSDHVSINLLLADMGTFGLYNCYTDCFFSFSLFLGLLLWTLDVPLYLLSLASIRQQSIR
jgi:hypothetical protein